jgi:hypothetical protein
MTNFSMLVSGHIMKSVMIFFRGKYATNTLAFLGDALERLRSSFI